MAPDAFQWDGNNHPDEFFVKQIVKRSTGERVPGKRTLQIPGLDGVVYREARIGDWIVKDPTGKWCVQEGIAWTNSPM